MTIHGHRPAAEPHESPGPDLPRVALIARFRLIDVLPWPADE